MQSLSWGAGTNPCRVKLDPSTCRDHTNERDQVRPRRRIRREVSVVRRCFWWIGRGLLYLPLSSLSPREVTHWRHTEYGKYHGDVSLPPTQAVSCDCNQQKSATRYRGKCVSHKMKRSSEKNLLQSRVSFSALKPNVVLLIRSQTNVVLLVNNTLKNMSWSSCSFIFCARPFWGD